MQEDLSKIVSELRKETCPQRVLNKVRGQIAANEASRGRLRYAMALAVVAVVVACCFTIWRWHTGANAPQQTQLIEHTKPDRDLVAHQAETALAFVGSELLDAGAHSEKIISDRAVPPLRNSIEITKNKLIHPMEL